MKLLSQGKTYRQIANILGRSIYSVNHRITYLGLSQSQAGKKQQPPNPDLLGG